MNSANSFASLVIVRNGLFLITVLSLLAFSGCSKEDDAKPAVASMKLTGNLDGKPWQADGFLVENCAAPRK